MAVNIVHMQITNMHFEIAFAFLGSITSRSGVSLVKSKSSPRTFIFRCRWKASYKWSSQIIVNNGRARQGKGHMREHESHSEEVCAYWTPTGPPLTQPAWEGVNSLSMFRISTGFGHPRYFFKFSYVSTHIRVLLYKRENTPTRGWLMDTSS